MFVCYDVKDMGLIIRVNPRRRGQAGPIIRVDLHGGREAGPIHLLQQIEQGTAGAPGSSAAAVFIRSTHHYVPSVWWKIRNIKVIKVKDLLDLTDLLGGVSGNSTK